MKLIPDGRRFFLIMVVFAFVGRSRADNEFPTDFAGADANIGERLFLETRFSHYFFTNCNGDANATVPGDPAVATLATPAGLVPGPFAGQSMNCRQCHLVDEEGYGEFGNHTLGNRTYSDFTSRSPIPLRSDGLTHTTRNAMGLVDALIPRSVPLFLHQDGQFASAHDLIIATLTGRNYGWEPSEYATAVHHIASIIRNDNGLGYLALTARGSRFAVELPGETAYKNIFSGFTNYAGSYLYDPRSLTANLISPQYRLDMRGQNATDEQILDTIATLIEAYLRNLFFSQTAGGLDFEGNGTPVFNGSPFDVFLIKNHLPQSPAAGETPAQYSGRLRQLISRLTNPQYVTDPADGHFETQLQSFQFGPTELKGLKIFLADPGSAVGNSAREVGNCAACHVPPAFTDFIFHNTGASQEEFEALHGAGSFARLAVPDLATRQADYNAFLPPTPNHPLATGKFESPPSRDQPGEADLGLWNVYANPDFPAPQPGIQQILPNLLGLTIPQIASAVIDGRSGASRLVGRYFDLRGSNGTPGTEYYVLTAQNPRLPMTNWDMLMTNTFDQQGRFQLSLPIARGTTQTFFRLSPALPAPGEILPRTLARFKTPTLRDLGQSAPYLHTGRMQTIEEVILFYQTFSTKARLGEVRNADPELRNIDLDFTATAPLAAFLRSLNEDYTD